MRESLVTMLFPSFISERGSVLAWRRTKREERTPHVPAEDDMVLHVLADGGEVELHGDVRALQGRAGPDPAQLEDVWGLDGPGQSISMSKGYQHLGCGWTDPAQRMTSLPALTVYTLSPCANSAPVATMPSACLVVSRRCTVAPVRTLRFGRPSAGKRYACGASACEDAKHVLERERTSNRTEADVLRVPVRGSTVDAHLKVPACCITASHD